LISLKPRTKAALWLYFIKAKERSQSFILLPRTLATVSGILQGLHSGSARLSPNG
jgi:hypothetical protein